MVILRRVGLATVVVIVGLVLLLAVEVLIASRVQRLEGFTRQDLDRQISGGDLLRVTWIGDSTSAGVGSSSADRALPVLVAERLGRGVDLSVLSVSGARTEDAIREQLPLLEATRPDWVFLAIGNNDVTGLTSRGALERQMRQLLDGVAALQPDQIIVLGIAEFGGTPLLARPLRNLAGLRGHQLDAVVREEAQRAGATYVPIARLTRDGFAADPAGTHAADRFHPSDAGYQLWADATVDTLEEAGLIRVAEPG